MSVTGHNLFNIGFFLVMSRILMIFLIYYFMGAVSEIFITSLCILRLVVLIFHVPSSWRPNVFIDILLFPH